MTKYNLQADNVDCLLRRKVKTVKPTRIEGQIPGERGSRLNWDRLTRDERNSINQWT